MKRFINQIYPIRIYVHYGDGLNDNSKLFLNDDGTKLKFDIGNSDAVTYYNIKTKSKNLSCIVLWFEKFDIPVIAHEATHAASRIFEYIGEDNPSKEAYAYLVEWVVRCCVETNNK